MLKISTDGRKAALDIRLVQPDPAPGRSKVTVAADRIAGIYHHTKDNSYRDSVTDTPHPVPGALQLVFCDLSTPTGDDRWNVYEELKAQLVDRGVPADGIRFIHDARNDVDKGRLFAAARAGHVSVLLGSTQKMGVGTNVQARAIALHHLDCPWRPADLEQRDGRILRQGNQNPEVQVIRYSVEQSFDAYSWQTVERKARFIAQVMRGRIDVREMEDVGDTALSFAEAKALASGDPLVLQKATADADLARLERLSRAHHRNLSAVTVRVHHADAQVAAADTDLPLIRQGMDRTVDTRGDAFTATITGTPVTDRAQAPAAVRDWLTSTVRRYGADRERDLGTVATLGVHEVTATEVPHRGAAPDVRFALAGIPRSDWTLGYEHVRDTGGIRQMENRITGLPELHRRVAGERTQAQATADDGRRALARPFKHADDLTQARARVDEITTDIHIRQTAAITTETPAPAETAAAPAGPGFADRLHQLSDRMKNVGTTIAALHHDDSEKQIPDQDIHVDDYDDEQRTAAISTSAPRL